MALAGRFGSQAMKDLLTIKYWVVTVLYFEVAPICDIAEEAKVPIDTLVVGADGVKIDALGEDDRELFLTQGSLVFRVLSILLVALHHKLDINNW